MARKKQPGARTKSGRLSRGAANYDRGNDRVRSLKERFGTFYVTASGRMFASGLMGPQDVALGRYQGLQRFCKLYARIYGAGGYRCPLDQTPKGMGEERIDPDQAERDREWMRHAMQSLEMSGVYPYMEQVLCPNTVDQGPPWLDRMLDVLEWNQNLANLRKQTGQHHERKQIDPRDQMVADAVNRALDILAPARVAKVVAQRWDEAA